MILDGTSADAISVNKYLRLFANTRAAAILVAESGFKNQQNSADLNQYGVVRIFARTYKIREKLYTILKEKEPPLLSPTSHRHRHLMKIMGAVPTNKEMLQPTVTEAQELAKRNKLNR